MEDACGQVVHVVAHTHWDREWYMTFDRFNRRMVAMLDEIIEVLESDASFTSFMLDGTTILLDDYLEIRPEMREHLQSLVSAGRIKIGPWYVMPDEFLVSGESLVRNLAKGIATCHTWNTTAMNCGYLVDVFGHTEQMPQILRLFAIKHAVVFRGIGDFPEDAFIWRAPDGSEVVAAKLDKDRSYSTWYFAMRWPFDAVARDTDQSVKRARELAKHLARSGGKHLLALDGVDHMELDATTPDVIATVNSTINPKQQGTQFILSSLEQYFNAVATEKRKLKTIDGALYRQGCQGINNHLLKHVLSAILPVKQANDACETELTVWAEPFEAICASMGRSRNNAFIQQAWTLLMQNHPHDSICGCSITRVHQDNLHRFDRVQDITGDVVDDVLSAIANAVALEGRSGVLEGRGEVLDIVVFNPSALAGRRIVQVRVPVACTAEFNATVRNHLGSEIPWQVVSVERNVESTVVQWHRLPQGTRQDIWTIAMPLDIPPMGYTSISVENHTKPPFNHGDFSWPVENIVVRHSGTLKKGTTLWNNGIYDLSLDGGHPAIRSKWQPSWQPLFHLVDEGDAGDGWNYRKPVSDAKLHARCMQSSVILDGPLLVCLRTIQRLDIPVSLDQTTHGRSSVQSTIDLTVDITMRRDDPQIDIRVSFDNTCTGHRVRMLFPIPAAVKRFSTSTAYAVTDWDLEQLVDTNTQEQSSAVVPNQGFIAVRTASACLHLSNKGLYECEIDQSDMLSVTLLRSFEHEVGRRYQAGHLGRALGKQQMLLAWAMEDPAIADTDLLMRTLAWKAGTRSVVQGMVPDTARVYSRIADTPFRTSTTALPRQKSFVSTSAGQVVLSAIQWIGGALVIRLYAVEQETQRIELSLPFPIASASEATPDGVPKGQGGREITTHGNRISFELDRREIITIAAFPFIAEQGEI